MWLNSCCNGPCEKLHLSQTDSLTSIHPQTHLSLLICAVRLTHNSLVPSEPISFISPHSSVLLCWVSLIYISSSGRREQPHALVWCLRGSHDHKMVEALSSGWTEHPWHWERYSHTSMIWNAGQEKKLCLSCGGECIVGDYMLLFETLSVGMGWEGKGRERGRDGHLLVMH